MKLTSVVILLLVSWTILLGSNPDQYVHTASGLSAKLTSVRTAPMQEDNSPDNNDGLDTVSYISKTYALPYDEVRVQVNSMTWNVFDQAGNFLFSDQNYRDDTAIVANSFTFREMKGFTIKILAQYNDGSNIRTINSIDFDIIGSAPITIPNEISSAFIDAYKSLADNWDTCYLRSLPLSRPKMLIISHTQLANYQTEFIKWKQQKGFEVFVLNKSDIGTTLDQFRNAIASHYNQYHSDYVILMGDVTGNYSIPTAFYPSPEYQENDADDHQYVCITGNDYFPEMLIGRFSFNDVSEFLTMTNKTIAYEKTPFMTDTNWMRRAITVAGNYAEGGLRPTTPIHMSRWLRNRLLDYGYAAVDTVYYPPTFPGTTLIQSAINQGVQFVSYRGWGDANGWHYPYFHLTDLNSTFNGQKLPIVFSIVCNTGDFANTVNPSFGEKWMRMGTMTAPNGCVAFVGPSDLHTKTRLNNSISSGAFRAILDYGVRGFGTSVLIGKMELYKNFPNDLAPGQYVEFYHHVYNLLCDPSLNMWVLVPNTIPESVILSGNTFPQSATHIEIDATNLDGAIITGTKNGTTYTYVKAANGSAILPIDPNQTGNLLITISKDNMVPLVKTLNVTAAANASMLSYTITTPTASSTNSNYSIDALIKNNTTSALTGLSVEISSPTANLINFANATVSIANLAAGESSHAIFNFSTIQHINPNVMITLNIIVKRQNEIYSTHKLEFLPLNAQFVVLSHTGSLNLGQNNAVSFQIQNTGSKMLSGASLELRSLVPDGVTVTPSTYNLGDFAVNETKVINANIMVSASIYEGRNIPLYFKMNNTDHYFPSSRYSVVAGNPSSNDPTGPCSYGYFAYDSTDLGYSSTPVYNWVEIDPADGGMGSVYEVIDDGSRVIDLPFTFKFYGQDYNQITICSNGWMSFGATDMFDFYNHYIPAALGPNAMIAGYWDDLKGMKTGVDNEGNGIFNNLRVCYWYDSANNRYIVEWNDAYNQYNIDLMENASLEKFQIMLYPRQGQDGDIIVQYHTVDNPGTTTNYCTVGIEDHNQLNGLTYTHGNQYPITAALLQAGLAIKFTTTPPDNFSSNNDGMIQSPFVLEQNIPNPFNPSTTISFNANIAAEAKLEIVNIRGQVIRTLLSGFVSAGRTSVVWDGKDDFGSSVSSGIYFYKLDLGSKTETMKMLMIK